MRTGQPVRAALALRPASTAPAKTFDPNPTAGCTDLDALVPTTFSDAYLKNDTTPFILYLEGPAGWTPVAHGSLERLAQVPESQLADAAFPPNWQPPPPPTVRYISSQYGASSRAPVQGVGLDVDALEPNQDPHADDAQRHYLDEAAHHHAADPGHEHDYVHDWNDFYHHD